MNFVSTLLGAAALAVATPFAAAAQVVVVQGSAAADCHENAVLKRIDRAAFHACDAALDSMLSPHDRAATYVNRGIIKFHAGDETGALRDFARASNVMDDLPEPYENVALVRLHLRDWSGAIDAVEEAFARGATENARLYNRRAIAFEALGQVDRAIEDYEAAAALDPDWDEPRQDAERLRRRAALNG
jgi:tetratricopeptide (TPR) repeat protein